MSISVKITKPLENGYNQVDAEYSSGYKRYYKVPKNNSKIFAQEYKLQEKKLNTYTNIAYFVSVFAGVLGASLFTRKIEGWMKKFMIQFTSAISLTALTMFGMNEYSKSNHDKLMKKYDSKEIFYRA